jgi:hypothetical protein
MRTVAARTHLYADDPAAPGTCLRCGRADPKRINRVHQVPDLTEAQDEHRRRAGESEQE